MSLQYISDGEGKVLGVFIPIDEWDELKSKPEVKEVLVKIEMESRITESEKAEIKEGISQLDKGEKFSYESVMKKYR